MEGHEGYEALGNGGNELPGDEVIKPPLSKESQPAAENTEYKTLDHKRQPDKAVRRADHLHYRDLVAPAKGSKLYRVRHDEYRDEDKYRYQHKRDNADDIADRDKGLCVLKMRVDLGDSVDRLERRFRL